MRKSRKRTRKSSEDDFSRSVQGIIESVRPGLQAHGGDVELVETKGRDIVLKVKGACVGCPLSQITFGLGIERMLREKIPEIGEITYSEK